LKIALEQSLTNSFSIEISNAICNLSPQLIELATSFVDIALLFLRSLTSFYFSLLFISIKEVFNGSPMLFMKLSVYNLDVFGLCQRVYSLQMVVGLLYHFGSKAFDLSIYLIELALCLVFHFDFLRSGDQNF